MKRFLFSVLLLLICASITSLAAEPKDATKNRDAKPAATDKANSDQHLPKEKKQKASKQKQHHAKHKKGPPSASSVPYKPETVKADPYSKAPETKKLPPTIR